MAAYEAASTSVMITASHVNFGKMLLAFFPKSELTASDVLFRLSPVSFEQRESNKVHLDRE